MKIITLFCPVLTKAKRTPIKNDIRILEKFKMQNKRSFIRFFKQNLINFLKGILLV
ncbi:hypothetical protein MmmBen326_0438 [Mycoplasma mycoides subsp. mycoides]|nr:hypothetical protein MmmBen326_0438 [Mycoplasma mycoides subsp. mycoides]